MPLLKAVLTAFLLISATPAFSQPEDLKQLIRTLEKDLHAEYQSVMDQFIAASKASDLKTLMALTSPITRQRQGDDIVRKMHKEHYVVLFTRYPNVSKDGDNTFFNDPEEHGWIFKRVASNKEGKSISFYVVVLEEGGKKYVSAVGLNK